MDKFFIQNAFKTLDEIESELNQKEILQEELKEDLTSDLDMDELEDKYLGLGCSINDPESEYVDDHGSIQSLVDFEGDFENSIWKVTLDTGISLNVSGKSLTVDLEEKLPKDLAKAYKNSAGSIRATKAKDETGETTGELKHTASEFFPRQMPRRKVTIDFENSNYTEISKEEALKKYKDPGQRCKLRVVFRPNTDYPRVMMWDEDNTPIIKPQDIEYYVQGNAWSFKNVINAADKIYVTDEDEHKIVRTNPTSTPFEPDSMEARAQRAKGKITYWNQSAEDKLVSAAADSILRKEQPEIDTGDHSKKIKKTYEHRQLLRRQDEYNKLLKAYEENPNDENIPNRIKYALDYLRGAQKEYNKAKATRLHPNKEPISRSLAELIILKFLLKKEKEKFESTNSGRSSDLQYHRYNELSQKLERLGNELKELTNRIQTVKAEMTPELQADYEEKMQDALLKIGDEYIKLLNDLKALRSDKGLGSEEETNESLNEDITTDFVETQPKEESHLRIYTVNSTGYEDFIDDDWDSEEKALDQAKELGKDEGYDRVCLVKIKYLPELNDEDVDILFDSTEDFIEEDLEEEIKDKRSIGEIVDDIMKNESLDEEKDGESLTESKSFNLKDENQVVDAIAYKGVGEETEEKLVVVDPSVESEDEEFEPHVGDAILQCKECKTTIFVEPEKLEKDGDTNVYNKDMPCPHCGAKSGFLYLYQAAEKPTEEKPEEEKPTEEKEDGDVEVKVDEDDNVTLEPVESDFIELDKIDNVKEESFEKLVNPYLTKLYENVESFKMTNIDQIDRKTLKLEGKLTSTNGKEKLVEFLFTIKENNADSIVFEGYNKILTEDTKAYNLKGKLEDNELVFESFEYKYNKNVDGEDILIEGIEK